MATTTIKITHGGETVTLTANLTEASAPLVVDGSEIGRQTADARHRTDLAVALAARAVWPESEWPGVPSTGSIGDDWSEGCEAWDDLEYTTISKADALGYFEGRGEAEVVVNPRHIGGITLQEIGASE